MYACCYVPTYISENSPSIGILDSTPTGFDAMKYESQRFLIVDCSCCREQRYLNFHKIRSVAEKFTAGP